MLAPSPLRAQDSGGWQANSDDAILLDVRSGKYSLGDSVRGYQTIDGVCVDLADVIVALDLPLALDKKSRRATGWIFAENQRLTIDRESGTEQIMNNKARLAPTAVYDTPEGWCVDTRTLARWLDVELTVDLGNALLHLKSARKLPFEAALERKERAARIRPTQNFDLSSLPQSRSPYRLWRTPSVDAVVTVGGLKNNRTGQSFDAKYELFASGELAGASFDARLSSNNRAVPESLRLRAYRTDPKGKLLGPLAATHIAIGDVSAPSTPLVAQNGAGRGLLITNRPTDRPDFFDRTSFRGELPVGWEAELYRNDQLLAFAETRADGRYEFIDVALLYGVNRFEIVLYGPQGQVRRETRTFNVGLGSIPPRQTYYWANVQQSGRDLITLGRSDDRPLPREYGWRAGVGVERGLDVRTSLSAALFSLQIDAIRYELGEVALRRAIGTNLVELSGALNDRGKGALRGQWLGSIGGLSVSGETIWAQSGFVSDRITEDIAQEHRLALDANLRLGSRFSLPLHLDAELERSHRGSSSLAVNGRSSLNFRRFSITGELSWRQLRSALGERQPDELSGNVLINGRLGKLRLRGEASFGLSGTAGLRSLGLTGEWDAGETSNWRAALNFDPRDDRLRAAVGWTKHFDAFALTANVEGASDGSVAAGVNLAFSFGPDPRGGGVRFSRFKLASQGQVLARVYRDRNRDGVRQADEPLERGISLTAGRTIALTPTDAQGEAVIDNLDPFVPISIGIDGGSLPDPLVQPALPGIVVEPRPGIAMMVEIPLVAAGEVEGTLVKPAGGTLSGVQLELIDVEGRVARQTVTEFDGFFLFEGVPYGDYRIRIGALSAQAIRAQPLLPGTVRVNEAQPIASAGIVAIALRQQLAGGQAAGESGAELPSAPPTTAFDPL